MEARIILGIIIFIVVMTVRIVDQYERRVVLTFGKFTRTLGAGINFIIPMVERTINVDIREKAVDVPSQEAMTKDNISCTVNAVIYYRIKDDQVERAVLNVRNLDYAMTQFALTTMRNIVGQFELDELLAKREEAASKIKEIVDEKSDAWGVDVLSVELKDINIPDDLKRTIGKQAEAEREKRAKIITSEGELASAENLKKAATMLAEAPGALHLRTLQSINDISSDQSNTTIWMVPIEILDAIKGLGETLGKKH
ncbi:MAG: slipin family protein [Candidatus Absconditicoccaceae bacterium]|nr:MAG: slipin family protein [Candidatus Gracilibacteria bacterium]